MGYRDDCSDNRILRDRDPLYSWLRPVGKQGEPPMIEPIVLLAIVVLLLAYLIFALLRPEKF